MKCGQHRQANYIQDGEQPGMSGYNRVWEPERQNRPFANHSRTPEQKADQLIKDAKLKKARIHQTRGKNSVIDIDHMVRETNGDFQCEFDLSRNFVHSAMVDESYHIVGSHVDEMTQEKIINGEYMDFSKLVLRDRILMADE